MIRALRRGQPLWALACGLCGLAALGLAFVERPAWPLEQPARLSEDPPSHEEFFNDSRSEFQLRVRHWRAPDRIALQVLRQPVAPDLLVYAAPAAAAAFDENPKRLPPTARLLGPLDRFREGHPVELGDARRLLFFSLGHGRVLAEFPLTTAR